MSVWDQQIRNAVNVGRRRLPTRPRCGKKSPPSRTTSRSAWSWPRPTGSAAITRSRSKSAVWRWRASPNPAPRNSPWSAICARSNQRAEAIAGLEAFLKAHPESGAEYYSWLGILRDESGLWPLGEPAHRKALELAPATDSLHNNLGYNLLMQKKNEEAAGEFREALKLNPGSQMARNNLGIALAQSNAPAQAVANWQSASDPATAHNNLAAVWIEKGNYAEARKELDLALGYNRAHPAALRNLELIGRLDGKPATLQAKPVTATRWQRFGSSVRKLFVGPLDDSRTEAAKSASAQ